jgi:hypothetical protein
MGFQMSCDVECGWYGDHRPQARSDHELNFKNMKNMGRETQYATRLCKAVTAV